MIRQAEKCWGCGVEALPGELCAGCGRPQPFPSRADHWAVLGIERRLVLERADLERRFHALNRCFHPDYFRLRSSEEQEISFENSAAVNTAYRTLRDPVSRIEYLLTSEGMALDGGQARPPAELFEEIMELQEARQELAVASPDEAPALRARLEAARAELEARRAQTEADLLAAFPLWDAGADGERGRLLAVMREALARRAYLGTALRDLNLTLGSGEGRTD